MHLLVLVLLNYYAESTTFTLPSRVEQCLFLNVPQDKSFGASYVISGRNDREVEMRVVDPSNKILYKSTKHSREGNYETKATAAGAYVLCFKNFDRYPKFVSFNFDVVEGSEDLSTGENFSKLNALLRSLTKETDTVYRNIQFYRKRETVHRDLLENACDNILWSSLFKMLAIIGICVAQIMIFKNLFKNQKTSSV